MPTTEATVTIDRTNDRDRYRFTCPNGHTTWDRTNAHGWCPSCARASKRGADVEPEFYEVYDKKHDQTIHYDAIEFDE